jgi:hypothetical protein
LESCAAMNYKQIFVLSLVFCQSVFDLKADTIPLRYNNIQLHYGFIIPHSAAIREVSYTHPAGIEFTRGKFHSSYNDWQVFNNYWISGMSVRYFNLQYPKVLGSVFDVSVFAGPVISHSRKHLLTITGGAGLSYQTKIYNPADNPLNQFFSSRISFPVYINAKLKYSVGSRTFLTVSGCYNHISNGGIRQPNKGMNFPTLALGIEQFNTPIPDLKNNFNLKPGSMDRSISFVLQFLSSYRVISGTVDFPEKGCLVYGINLHASKPLGYLYAINAGGEFIIDGYIRETIVREKTGIDHKRFAFLVGQDFTFGRAIFAQYLGIYAYAPYKARNPVYQKYELLYRTKGRLMFGVFIKAHLQVAELMGVNLNYQLIKPKSKDL